MESIQRNDDVPDGGRNNKQHWSGFAQDAIHGVRATWERPVQEVRDERRGL